MDKLNKKPSVKKDLNDRILDSAYQKMRSRVRIAKRFNADLQKEGKKLRVTHPWQAAFNGWFMAWKLDPVYCMKTKPLPIIASMTDLYAFQEILNQGKVKTG